MRYWCIVLMFAAGCSSLNRRPEPFPVAPIPSQIIPIVAAGADTMQQNAVALLAILKGAEVPRIGMPPAVALQAVLDAPDTTADMTAPVRGMARVYAFGLLDGAIRLIAQVETLQREDAAKSAALADEQAGRKADAEAAEKAAARAKADADARYNALKDVQDLRARYALCASFALILGTVAVALLVRVFGKTGTIGIVIIAGGTAGAAACGAFLGWPVSEGLLVLGKFVTWGIIGLGTLALVLVAYWMVRTALAYGAKNPINDKVNSFSEALLVGIAPRMASNLAAAQWDAEHVEKSQTGGQ